MGLGLDARRGRGGAESSRQKETGTVPHSFRGSSDQSRQSL